MEKNEAPAYWALLGLSLALSVLAVLTLIPNPSASKPNVLGYRSLCSFAPAATALCGILAGITCTLRNRLVSRRASSMRYRPPIVPALVIVLLAAVATVSGLSFGAAQSRFAAIIQRTAAGPSLAASGAAAASELVDGTRQGDAREGEVSATVEARVKDGRIEALRLVAGANVEGSVAETLFARIKSAGGTAVDVVSGATASSAVLLKAAAAALR